MKTFSTIRMCVIYFLFVLVFKFFLVRLESIFYRAIDTNAKPNMFSILLLQESFFMYFFGVREPGCYGAIDVQTGHTTLFVPKLPAEYATWMGRLWTCEDYSSRYGVDVVRYVNEVSHWYIIFFSSALLTHLHSRLNGHCNCGMDAVVCTNNSNF